MNGTHLKNHTLNNVSDGTHGSDTDLHSTGMHTGMLGHSMKPYFHAGVSETILFQVWSIDSVAGIAWSTVVVFLAGVFYECLESWRMHLLTSRQTCKCCRRYDSYIQSSNQENTYVKNNGGAPTVKCEGCSGRESWLSCGHWLQTFLHLIQTTYSYSLMLIFMTYNVWLCGGLVLGCTLGYFCFGWKRKAVIDNNDHCQ